MTKVPEKIKVYATCFWEDDESLLNNTIRHYGFGQASWKNIEFTLESNFDRLVILTYPNRTCKYGDFKDSITFLTEPPCSLHIQHREASMAQQAYLQLPFWNNIGPADRTKILQVSPIRKTKLLSSVTSDLYHLEGHQRRLELICKLDSIVEDGLDVWGKEFNQNFFTLIRSYKGSIADKYKGLWPYKYHFACENSFYPNYFTEKIIDPVIAQCLCFYDGCSNIEEFIDERAFVKIDVRKPDQAIEVIIDTIEHDMWEKRIKYIRRQKERLLYELNPLNLIWMAVNDMDVLNLIKL